MTHSQLQFFSTHDFSQAYGPMLFTCEIPQSTEGKLESDVDDACFHAPLDQLKQFFHVTRLGA